MAVFLKKLTEKFRFSSDMKALRGDIVHFRLIRDRFQTGLKVTTNFSGIKNKEVQRE